MAFLFTLGPKKMLSLCFKKTATELAIFEGGVRGMSKTEIIARLKELEESYKFKRQKALTEIAKQQVESDLNNEFSFEVRSLREDIEESEVGNVE